MGKISYFLGKTITYLIIAYRYSLSPLLGNCCRFYPSCSEYAQTALERFGLVRGSFLLIKRLLCCHPWHEGGYNPVPDKDQLITK